MSTSAMNTSASYEKSNSTWVPEQEEERIQYAFKLIQDAYRSKAQTHENENRSLRLALDECKQTVLTLQKKNASMERDLIDAHQRCHALSEEAKNSSIAHKTVQKELEKHKRLQKTFAEALEMHHTIKTYDDDDDSRMDYAPSAHQTSALSDSSFRSAAVPNFVAPIPSAAATFPTVSPKHVVMPSAGNVSVGGQGATAGGGFDSNGVDGKQFFRTARARLDYEGFNAFLATIKRLNAHQQTRQATLDEAKRIFGADNADLFNDFNALLNRHA